MVNNDTDPNYFRTHLFNGISLAYIDSAGAGSPRAKKKATIVLLHGFPQCSYQFRSVIPLLAQAGYRVIAPDYRGAGESSKPTEGFGKAEMAADIVMLLDQLSLSEPLQGVGHDICGVIAFALGSRWPERVASLCLCEAFLPGTTTCETKQAEDKVAFFHFSFHCVPNLPEALLLGREKTYIEFFINQFS